MERSKIQESEFVKWKKSKWYGSKHNGVGILKWVTGAGKTYATCVTINKMRVRNPDLKVGIFTHRINLKNMWKENVLEICKDITNIDFFTVQTYLKKKEMRNYDLIIIDEIHNFYSSKYIDLITKQVIGYTYLIGLSATPYDDNGIYDSVIKYYCPVVSEITEQQAIEYGWILPSIEYNLLCELTEEERIYYNKLSSLITSIGEQFDNDFNFILKCAVGDKGVSPYEFAKSLVQRLEGQLTDFNKNLIFEYMNKARLYLKTVKTRKDLLGRLESKINNTLNIIEKYKDNVFMIFSEDISVAEHYYKILCDKYDKKVEIYHSGLSTIMVENKKMTKQKQLEKSLKNIKEKKSTILVTAKALDEGTNIPSIDFVIIINATSKSRQQIQRTGRGKRKSSADDNTILKVVNMVGKETQEQKSVAYRQNSVLVKKTIDTYESI
jgi:superfamily II DNA or RNA helicase